MGQGEGCIKGLDSYASSNRQQLYISFHICRNVSEFDQFKGRYDTHLCKLRDVPAARFHRRIIAL